MKDVILGTLEEIKRSEDNDYVIEKTFDKINDVLLKSYGPLGGSAIIHSNHTIPEVSKDGLTILKAMTFDDTKESDIHSLITSISNNLVEAVGDGSTSAVISSASLYKQINKFIEANQLTSLGKRRFIECLNKIQVLLVDIINKYLVKSLPTNFDERLEVLTNIAGVSNNNNFDIGLEVAKILRETHEGSNVKIEIAPFDSPPGIQGRFTYGHTIEHYVIHPIFFATDRTKTSISLSNVAVVMSNRFFDVHYEYLLKMIETSPALSQSPILVIADEVSKDIQRTILTAANTDMAAGRVPKITLLNPNGLDSSDGVTKFMDLSVYVNANPTIFSSLGETDFDLPEDAVLFGHAERVVILPNGTTTFELGYGAKAMTEGYNQVVEDITKRISELPKNHKLDLGRQRNRLNRMTGLNATIVVHGRTEDERRSLRYLVEDSVLACQSAIKSGYTIGGNILPIVATTIAGIILNDDKLLELNKELYEDLTSDESSISLLRMGLSIIQESYLAVVRRQVTLHFDEEVDNAVFLFEDLLSKILNGEAIEVNYEEDTITSIVPILNASNGNTEILIFGSDAEYKSKTTVLSSAITDTEILKAAFSILTLFLTSNQFL